MKDAARSDGNCRWKRIVHDRIWEKGVEAVDAATELDREDDADEVDESEDSISSVFCCSKSF